MSAPPRDGSIAAELEALGPSFEAFTRYYGAPPRARPLEDAPVEAWVVRYPALPPRLRPPFKVWLELPSFFRTQAFEAFSSALGYRADADGVVRQVPTPASFLTLFEHRFGRSPGYAPELITVDAIRVPPDVWFEGYASGKVTSNAPTAGLHRLFALPLRLRRPHGLWCAHLTALGHDMSIHALPLSMIGADSVSAIGDRARAALRRLGVGSDEDALVTFFEEDLSRHTLDVWRSVRGAPDAFGAAFDETLPSLFERLDHAARRGAEARRRRRARLEIVRAPAILRGLIARAARRLD